MKTNHLAIAMVLALIPAGSGAPGRAAEDPTRVLAVRNDAAYPRNGEGDIIELKDGRLALVYTRFASGTDDATSADLAMRTSADLGRTWSEPRTLVPNEGRRNVMSVSLLRERKTGNILVFYLRKNNPDNDCILYLRRSSDELASVGDPTRCLPLDGYQVVNNDRVIQLRRGRLLVAAAHHTDAAGKFTAKGIPISYFSDDGGASWRAGTPVLALGTVPEITMQEPGLVELEDGRVWMFMRTPHGYQYGCTSSDAGKTWTKPEPIRDLASPNSPATIERLPWTGDLVCVWNDHGGWHYFPAPNKRTPMALSISTDEGRTWSRSRVLDGDPEASYCYTSMTFTAGHMILSYYGPGGLRVMTLPRDWVLKQ